MDLDGSTGFKYVRDIRSLDDFNGVWNLRINDLGDEFMISSNQIGPFPEGLQVGLVNINERKVLLNFLDHKEVIPNNKNSVYDLKVIAGDQEYVKSMSQEILSSIPEQFSLGQNYPNPFNPSTTIKFSLDFSQYIDLKVYGVNGNFVETLIKGRLTKGQHLIHWNASNHPSGVYFIQIKSRNELKTQKVVLIK